jgi:hypothetical protein
MVVPVAETVGVVLAVLVEIVVPAAAVVDVL